MSIPPSSQRRVLLVAGTRPECLKLASVYLALSNRQGCTPILMNSGQHHIMVERTLRHLGIDCDVSLGQIGAHSLFANVTLLRSRIREATKAHGADILVAQGDTTTAYATALSSRDLGLPLAHIEAGLRTEHPSRPFPEEYFRRSISRIASLHFAPTRSAVSNLQREGIAESHIVRSGNTIVDLLRNEASAAEPLLPVPVPSGARVITLTLHRRENQGKGIQQASIAVKQLIADHPDLIAFCPLPANPSTRTQLALNLAGNPRIHLTEPLDYRPFIALLRRSSLAITDSGGIQEEAPHLGTPLLVVRQNTERVEEVALCMTKLVQATADGIYDAARRILSQPRPPSVPFDDLAPNGDGHAGMRIADRITNPVETP
ncbi:non-hydrolyzing UDP-N-acetylglucosamine 2-epimerase [Dyella sp. Tek66A03]|uniref:non-hydrolyzing UDP-N-acetylglucosamine 2-epimerase n=1 Tax=Dyella sp. Tek66A03 TaxID=3458298 RepID=UPI00403E4841